MYSTFFGLDKEPFNITPDPDFLYLSPSHREALASLAYGIEQRKGFIAITGEVGVGKTTIIRSFLQGINHAEPCPAGKDNSPLATICEDNGHTKFNIIYIFHANVSFAALLKQICRELEIQPISEDSFELVNLLHEKLIEEYRQDHNIVVIIDEAQNMPIETLENLRMLSNLETTKDKLLQIILVGQPEFDRMLEMDKLRQLKQRIAIRCKISPLNKKDSADYIEHRLREAGSNAGAVFSRGALKSIIKHSRGIPRVINVLCHNAMVTGIGYQKRVINSKIIREAVADLEGKSLPAFSRWAITILSLILMVGASWGVSKYWKEIQTLTLGTKQDSSVFIGRVNPDSAGSVLYGKQHNGNEVSVEREYRDRGSANAEANALSKTSIHSEPAAVTASGSRMANPGQAENVDPAVAIPQENISFTPAAGSMKKEDSGSSQDKVPEKTPFNPFNISAVANTNTDNGAPSSAPALKEENRHGDGKHIGAADNPESTQPAKPVSIIVKRGENLTGLIRSFYGFADDEVIEMVKQNNPQIRDTNIITPGQQILFPAYTKISLDSNKK
jgi:general secretion pathway protein A